MPDEYHGFARRERESDQAWAMRKRAVDALLAHGERVNSRRPNPYAPHAAPPEDQFANVRPKATQIKPKRANHNARSRTYWELLGYSYSRTETYDARFMRSKDLLGIFDSLILGNGETIGCQECSRSSVSARRKKMLAEPRLKAWLDSGNRAVILAWHKPENRWVPEVFEVTL